MRMEKMTMMAGIYYHAIGRDRWPASKNDGGEEKSKAEKKKPQQILHDVPRMQVHAAWWQDCRQVRVSGTVDGLTDVRTGASWRW